MVERRVPVFHAKDGLMTDKKPPLTVPQYERMAKELHRMSDEIRARPEIDHNMADRLEKLVKDMREDEVTVHPEAAE
jgi:hypothetical protein